MLRRNLGDSLHRKGCDDSFLRWSMLRRNPSGVLRRKVPWTLHISAFLVQIPYLLLKCSLGSRGSDLYSITLQDTFTPNPVCLMAKASSSQAWLLHRRLSHLNFDTINLLSKYDIVTALPKLKFVKDHICSSCELRKAKHKSFKTKTTPSSKRRLQILHMDLCGPMRVLSFNGKKYVLVIVDDYSRYMMCRCA
ncbi:retrovirus-related pol polyprotein from transposon TNT 1-94 [Tanacetum coccineum]|uniref:Retrovirus-related pol polyprotein from transposon TNT 1-94 n=1 Tax=Tanacetum coccineum TaxID=301880 RepID=A0ABQ4WWP4_9ASTR